MKTRTWLIVLSICALVLGWLGSYSLNYHNSGTSVPSEWKLYKNTRFGLEFRYPSEWSISEIEEAEGSLHLVLDQESSIDLHKHNDIQLIIHPPTDPKYNRPISVEEYLDLYYKSFNYQDGSYGVREDRQGVTIYTIHGIVSDSPYETFDSKRYIYTKNGLVYEFAANYAGKKSELKDFFESFDKVVSTFKFTK